MKKKALELTKPEKTSTKRSCRRKKPQETTQIRGQATEGRLRETARQGTVASIDEQAVHHNPTETVPSSVARASLHIVPPPPPPPPPPLPPPPLPETAAQVTLHSSEPRPIPRNLATDLFEHGFWRLDVPSVPFDWRSLIQASRYRAVFPGRKIDANLRIQSDNRFSVLEDTSLTTAVGRQPFCVTLDHLVDRTLRSALFPNISSITSALHIFRLDADTWLNPRLADTLPGSKHTLQGIRFIWFSTPTTVTVPCFASDPSTYLGKQCLFNERIESVCSVRILTEYHAKKSSASYTVVSMRENEILAVPMPNMLALALDGKERFMASLTAVACEVDRAQQQRASERLSPTHSAHMLMPVFDPVTLIDPILGAHIDGATEKEVERLHAIVKGIADMKATGKVESHMIPAFLHRITLTSHGP